MASAHVVPLDWENDQGFRAATIGQSGQRSGHVPVSGQAFWTLGRDIAASWLSGVTRLLYMASAAAVHLQAPASVCIVPSRDPSTATQPVRRHILTFGAQAIHLPTSARSCNVPIAVPVVLPRRVGHPYNRGRSRRPLDVADSSVGSRMEYALNPAGSSPQGWSPEQQVCGMVCAMHDVPGLGFG